MPSRGLKTHSKQSLHFNIVYQVASKVNCQPHQRISSKLYRSGKSGSRCPVSSRTPSMVYRGLPLLEWHPLLCQKAEGWLSGRLHGFRSLGHICGEKAVWVDLHLRRSPKSLVPIKLSRCKLFNRPLRSSI